LFGPVPSRRLGRSLGVDLLVPKTCTYDCVFCEVGRTTHRTLERREYASVDDVMAELQAWRRNGGEADRITVAGSGEPTLHTRVGDVLDGIGRLSAIPSALLTNGSLFYLPEVRAAATHADLVKASLSAWDATSFEAINRPAPGLGFVAVVEGLRTFRSEFHGEFWLEVVLVEGVNDTLAGVEAIARIAEGIHPDRVHLNTVVRPPAFPSARAVSRGRLEEFSRLFKPTAEVIIGFDRSSCRSGRVDETAIIAMVNRRPCTQRDLEQALEARAETLAPVLRELLRQGKLQMNQQGGGVYYRSVAPANQR